MVKFSTKFGAVPVIDASASVPGAPVVTVPIVNVGVSPAGPVGPVHPTKSVKNNQNIENKGIEAHSRYTFFGTKSQKELRF